MLSNTDSPSLLDAIELHNTTDTPIDVSGWYLSDSWGSESNPADGNYKKYSIPNGSVIPAHGYVVFDEDDFNPSGGVDPGAHPYDFALDGSHGDDIWLMEADATGRLTRFVDHVTFGAAVSDESFGRWPNGVGDLYPMALLSLDKARPGNGFNSGPRVGPVVISEVHYNPNGVDNHGLEFIGIYNSTAVMVNLSEWRARGGGDFDFADDTVLGARSACVLVPFDVSDTARLSFFRDYYGIDASVAIVGGYSGWLGDDGGTVRLQRPNEPDPLGYVPRLLEDEVLYDDHGDWPTEPDGHGHSLNRLGSRLWGDYSASWAPAEPSPGSVEMTAQVIGRRTFYNDSAFDGNDPQPNHQDDQAIASDKDALLPGETADFSNYTSYSRGLNGIMVDIVDLGNVVSIEDFEFKVGNREDPNTWLSPPSPISVTTRPGDGFNNSDRVTLIWEDNAIEKQWLQVTVLPGANTGLAEPDVFYFGNAIGETGNATGDAKVTAFDMLGARDNQRNFLDPASIDFAFDFNRNARVNALDMLISRNNQTHFLNALRLITVPGTRVALQDAVLELAGERESTRFSAKLDWLYEFDPANAQGRHAEKGQSVEDVRNRMLAANGP